MAGNEYLLEPKDTSKSGKETLEYRKVLANMEEITEALKSHPTAKDSLCLKLKSKPEKPWLGINEKPSESSLVTIILGRIESSTSQYHDFLAMLGVTIGLDLVKKGIEETVLSKEESSQEQKGSEEDTHLQDAQKSGKAPPSSGTNDSGISASASSYSVNESSSRRPSTPTLVFPKGLQQRSLHSLPPTAPNEAAYNESPGSTHSPVSSYPGSQECGVANPHHTLPTDRYVAEKLRNLTLDGKQMEAVKEENQQLAKKVQQNEEALKNLKEKIENINRTKRQEIRNLENEEIKNEKELDQLKSHVAELQRELEEKKLELQKSLYESSAHVMQVRFHEQNVTDLKKELSEEKSKVEIKQKEITNLKDQLRDMEIDKMKLSGDYKDQIHAIEKEREVLKTKLEMGNCCLRLKLEMAEKNQVIQGELEKERNLRRVAEQEKEDVVRKLKASEDEVRDLMSQLVNRKSSWWF